MWDVREVLVNKDKQNKTAKKTDKPSKRQTYDQKQG